MPTQKLYDRYDKRLIALLDRAVKEPVTIRRKFRTYSGVYVFRLHLYQLRYAAREIGKKKKWDKLTFRIIGLDLIVGAHGRAFDTLLDEFNVDIGKFAER